MESRTYENRHSDMDVRVAVPRRSRREATARSPGAPEPKVCGPVGGIRG